MQSKRGIEVKFSREIIKTFKNRRVVSLLYFGTRAFGLNLGEDSDHDFMLILDKYKVTDAVSLRKIVKKKPFKNLSIDLNLIYLPDFKARGKTNFQMRALSLTFYQYLELAKALIGKNIFEKSPIKLSKKEIARLENNRIQEYYGRCDKLYVQGESDRVLYKQLSKYTKDIIWFLLHGQGVIQISDITTKPYVEILNLAVKNGFITGRSATKFQELLKSKFSNANLLELEKVRRRVYLKYLELFKSSG